MANNPTFITVVAAAIYHPDKRLLLQRRLPGKHHGNLWEFPGGKLEQGEHPRGGLAREIDEELGLTLTPAALEPLGFADEQGGAARPGVVLLLFETHDWSGPVMPAEGQEWGWFTREDAAKLDLAPIDRALLEKLAK